MVVVAASTREDWTPAAQVVGSQVYTFFAGISLAHLAGCTSSVSTAHHCLAACFKRYRAKVPAGWRLTLWAMPAPRFNGLCMADRSLLHRLCEIGAVPARGYYSLSEDQGFNGSKYADAPGVDTAIIEFTGSFPQLPAAGQPIVLSVDEARNVEKYMSTKGTATMDIVAEGVGSVICTSKFGGANTSSEVGEK